MPLSDEHVALLGTMPDDALAALAKVANSTVYRARALRGIASFGGDRRPRLQPPPDLLEQVKQKGKAAVAAEQGVSDATLMLWLRSVSAPPPAKRLPSWLAKVRERLGTVPDSVLAEEVGVSRQRMAQVRQNLGVTALHSPVYNRFNDAIQALYGVATDAEIMEAAHVDASQVSRWRKMHDLPAPVKREKEPE